ESGGGAAGERTRLLHELHDALLPPAIRERLPRDPDALVTIIPNLDLSAIPFAALVPDPAGPSYLVERHTLRLAPSITAFRFMQAQRHPVDARRPRMLLVGNPAMPDPKLPALPGAEHEVRAIAALYDGAPVAVLTGADATKARVLAQAKGASVLH